MTKNFRLPNGSDDAPYYMMVEEVPQGWAIACLGIFGPGALTKQRWNGPMANRRTIPMRDLFLVWTKIEVE